MKKLSILILLCTLSGNCVHAYQVQQGKIDISDSISEENREISLEGEWELFPNQLLFPGDSFGKPYLVSFPKIWNAYDEKDPPQEIIGVGTYRLTLTLDSALPYALYVPSVYNAFRLYFNGQMLAKNGSPSSKQDEAVAEWRPQTIEIPSEHIAQQNELILQISNFEHLRGGPKYALVIGDRDHLLGSWKLQTALDIFLSGALIMGGLFFLGLYLFGRQQKSILLFSLFCIVFSYYIMGSGNYAFHDLFPHLSWQTTIRLEYLSTYLSTILVVLFTKSLYPNETPKVVVRIMVPVTVIYILFLFFLPSTVFPKVHNYFLFATMIVVFTGVYVYIQAARRKRTGYLYSLIGMVVLLTTLFLRMVHHFVPINLPYYILTTGYMIYFFLHALTLSEQFAFAWKKARDEARTALEAKSEFLSVMSHEIRTPMNAVIGLTNHLIEDEPKPEQYENLNSLRFSAENLLILINDILDFSKLEAQKVEFEQKPVDVVQLASDLIKTFTPSAKVKGLTLTLDLDPEIPSEILCDSTRTAQVLTNLIGNAIKFTEEGEVILQISLDRFEKGLVTLLFCIRDTGIGIPQEHLSRIFDSFTQADSAISRKYGGTGLGLSITRRLLELQGVTLEVSSEVGQGTIFSFKQTFPLPNKKAIHPTAKPSEPQIEPIHGNILLVEDNEVNILVATKFLRRWGLTFEVAHHGKEALQAVENHSFDLILMDLQMPVMDGITASKYISTSHPHIPIVALTATAQVSEREDMTRAGMVDFVLKPYQPETLYNMLSKYLNAPQTQVAL